MDEHKGPYAMWNATPSTERQIFRMYFIYGIYKCEIHTMEENSTMDVTRKEGSGENGEMLVIV